MFKYIALFVAFLPGLIVAETSVWRVSKGAQSFYLGGTCHLLRSSDYPLPPEFELAYALSDTLVFEMDPVIAKDPEFALELLRASTYKKNNNLSAVLSEATYWRLAAQCERSGLPLEMLEDLKPGMILTLLTVKELQKLGVSEDGVDMHFHKRGVGDAKKVFALETPEFQIDLIASLGEGDEDKTVDFALLGIFNMEEHFETLVDAWRRGDLEMIKEHFVSDVRKQYPQLYSTLVAERNKRWLNSINVLIETPETEFILVGVAHLAGKKGLLNMLKKKGYTIEQISIPL